VSRAGREKHPDSLVNKWGGRYKPLQLVEAGEPRRVPPLSRSFQPETRRIWRELWRSRLAQAYQETDVPGLRRWVWYLNEWLRATSMPGDRRYVISLEKALRDLERAFGLDVLSRMRLGLTLMEGQKAVSGLKGPVEPQPFKEGS
jgi:hypothetical protein